MRKVKTLLLGVFLLMLILPLASSYTDASVFSALNGKGGGKGKPGGGSGGVDKSQLTIKYPWWNDVADVEIAHAAGYRGQNTVVVILDTGLGRTWKDLFPQQNILTQYCFSYTKALGKDKVDWDRDTEGHGTSTTATIIGYKLNDYYVEGVAPDAKIVMFRVLYWVGGVGKSAVTYSEMINNWAQAINDAIALHNNELSQYNMVISMSLGYNVNDPANANLEAAIDNARSQGIAVSVSAGNDGPSPNTTGYPANFVSATSVAAAGWQSLTGQYGLNGIFTDIAEGDFSELVIADFSSRGKVDITGIGWNLVLPSSDGNYYYISGTSFSCPQVSGVFALMFSAYGSVSVAFLVTTMQNTAYHASWMSADTWGAGFVQADGAVGL